MPCLRELKFHRPKTTGLEKLDLKLLRENFRIFRCERLMLMPCNVSSLSSPPLKNTFVILQERTEFSPLSNIYLQGYPDWVWPVVEVVAAIKSCSPSYSKHGKGKGHFAVCVYLIISSGSCSYNETSRRAAPSCTTQTAYRAVVSIKRQYHSFAVYFHLLETGCSVLSNDHVSVHCTHGLLQATRFRHVFSQCCHRPWAEIKNYITPKKYLCLTK